MGLPGNYSLTLYRGDSYSWRFVVWTDEAKTEEADLTGVTAKAEIRDKSGGLSIMTLECSIELPNVVNVALTADLWVDWLLSKGVWDLQLTYPGGEVVTVVAGSVSVTADVTDSLVLPARVAYTIPRR